MAGQNFKDSLKIGKDAEKYVAKLYMQLLHTKEKPSICKNSAYDFKLLNKTYEVKHDIRANQTGNLAFETGKIGNQGGLYQSQADYIIYMVNAKQIYEFVRTELINFISQEIQANNYKKVRGGDFNQFDLLLVPISTIEHFTFCKRII